MLLQLLSASGPLSEYKLDVEKCDRSRHDPVPEDMREPLEERGVDINIVFIDLPGRDLCLRELVIHFIGIVDYCTPVHVLHPPERRKISVSAANL